MRAALLHHDSHTPRLEEVTVEEPRFGEVLVKIAASGICGSDLHVVHNRSNVGKDRPVILGHEGAGVVEAVGPGVRDLKRGDHVVMAMFGPCGHCDQCNAGKMQFCDGPEFKSAVGRMADDSTRFSQDGHMVFPMVGVGSLAEYAVMREAMLVKVAPHLPLDRLCFCACSVTTGLGAVFNVAKVTPGTSVAVIGCGGVGLNVIQGARIAGASRIIAIDTNKDKLDIASNMGATDLLQSGGDPAEVDAAVKALEPRGVDFAFEVVGNHALIRQAIGFTGRGGTTVMIGGVPWASDVSVNAGLLFGERKLMGCLGGGNIPGREIPRIIGLYERGMLKLDELIGKTFDFDDIGAAIAEADRAQTAKTVVAIDRALL